MTDVDPHAFLPLKTQWFHVMLSLAGGEQHGYGMFKRKAHQFLPSAPELDDARRRYYRLTKLGRRVLDAECERLQELVHTIQVKRRMVTE